MGSVNILETAGLHTGNNELSATPTGGLFKGEEVVVRGKNVIEPRRGFRTMSGAALTGNPDEIYFYRDTVLVSTRNNKLDLVTEVGETSNLDASYNATPSDRDVARMRGFEIQDNFYYMSSKGLMRLDSPIGVPAMAGGPRCPDPLGGVTGTSGFLPVDSLVAYRVVFSIIDVNENEMFGPPSGRLLVSSVGYGSTSNVSLTIKLPRNPSTKMTVYVYRSTSVTTGSIPNDELLLVYRHTLTAPEILGTEINYIDRTPDIFLSEPLYTNAFSGEGFGQTNYPPPLSRDMALWDERAWYANTTRPESVDLQLLGVGSGTGLRLGDVLVVNGRRYVAWTTQNGAPPTGTGTTFVLVTELSDPYQNIGFTARNLVNAITYDNITNGLNLFATYLSSDQGLPGLIRIESLDVSDPEFSVTADTYQFLVASAARAGTTVTMQTQARHGFAVGDTLNLAATTVNPVFPVGTKIVASIIDPFIFTYTEAGAANGGTNLVPAGYNIRRTSPSSALAWNPAPVTDGLGNPLVMSDDDRNSQRLYYSKINEPEAVPYLNFIDVGVKDKAILRIIPLRDRLFIFKEDGVYILSGEAPYNVDLLDDSVKILAPDTAVAMANTIYCLTNQGVVSLSELGAQIVSRAIENDLVQLFSPDTLATLKSKAFGVGHEADRLYSLWLPNRAGSDIAYGFILNITSGAWTRWNQARSCGRVNPDTNSLYMGKVGSSFLVKERRTFTYLDYVDDVVRKDVGVYAPDTRMLTFSEDTSEVLVGAVVEDPFAGGFYRIVAKDGDTVTLDRDGFSEDAAGLEAQIFLPFECEVRWTNQDAEAPNNLKTWSEAHVIFKVANFKNGRFTFSTDTIPTVNEVPMEGAETAPNPDGLWAVFDQIIQARVYVDPDHVMSTFMRPGIRIREAMGFWQLMGMTLTYEMGGTAVTF